MHFCFKSPHGVNRIGRLIVIIRSIFRSGIFVFLDLPIRFLTNPKKSENIFFTKMSSCKKGFRNLTENFARGSYLPLRNFIIAGLSV